MRVAIITPCATWAQRAAGAVRVEGGSVVVVESVDEIEGEIDALFATPAQAPGGLDARALEAWAHERGVRMALIDAGPSALSQTLRHMLVAPALAGRWARAQATRPPYAERHWRDAIAWAVTGR